MTKVEQYKLCRKFMDELFALWRMVPSVAMTEERCVVFYSAVQAAHEALGDPRSLAHCRDLLRSLFDPGAIASQERFVPSGSLKGELSKVRDTVRSGEEYWVLQSILNTLPKDPTPKHIKPTLLLAWIALFQAKVGYYVPSGLMWAIQFADPATTFALVAQAQVAFEVQYLVVLETLNELIGR